MLFPPIGKKMSDSARQAEEMKRPIAKWMNFHVPTAKKRLAECLFGQAVGSAARQRKSAKPQLPSVTVEAAGSGCVLGHLTGDGTLRELLQVGILWTKGFPRPPKFFNLWGLRDGKLYLLPYNVPLVDLPDKVILVAVESAFGCKAHMLNKLSNDSDLLELASDQLKGDSEVVLAALRSYVQRSNSTYEYPIGGCPKFDPLRFATDGLRKDRRFVLAAVELDGWAIQNVAQDLKKDLEVASVAIQSVVKDNDYRVGDERVVLKYFEGNKGAIDNLKAAAGLS